MMSFEQVIDIFADYLALDTEREVCKSRYGYIRVEFHKIKELPGYCSGMVCRTPKELFDLLLSDYESYLEIQRTKGHRGVTEEDKKKLPHCANPVWGSGKKETPYNFDDLLSA